MCHKFKHFRRKLSIFKEGIALSSALNVWLAGPGRSAVVLILNNAPERSAVNQHSQHNQHNKHSQHSQRKQHSQHSQQNGQIQQIRALIIFSKPSVWFAHFSKPARCFVLLS